MNRIGTTTTGNVIVEMTPLEFEALEQIKGTSPATTVKAPAAPISAPEGQPGAAQMSHPELVEYVAVRLQKLKAKKKDAVVRSVEAMFQFTGGIGMPTVEKVLATLQHQGIVVISSDGKVSYPKG